ncbi:hypothetical protein GE09DRAFT_548914 [Coniochaeta sp. 2T2.1]|nr:hypothetical protein GE09DRAFT_548914 [Coniochaeta sp. 2T2.1]
MALSFTWMAFYDGEVATVTFSLHCGNGSQVKRCNATKQPGRGDVELNMAFTTAWVSITVTPFAFAAMVFLTWSGYELAAFTTLSTDCSLGTFRGTASELDDGFGQRHRKRGHVGLDSVIWSRDMVWISIRGKGQAAWHLSSIRGIRRSIFLLGTALFTRYQRYQNFCFSKVISSICSLRKEWRGYEVFPKFCFSCARN